MPDRMNLSLKLLGLIGFCHCPQLRLTSDNPHYKVINGLLVSSDGILISCLSKDTHIHIPNLVNQIGNYAFYGCSFPQDIHIPNTVNQIDYFAFSGCYTTLQAIHIPKGTMAKFMQLLPEGLHNKLVEIDRVSSSMFPF